MGFGDVKDKDKLMDHLMRQVRFNEESTANYPTLTNTFGGDAEVALRSQPIDENGKWIIGPVKGKHEDAYGELFLKAREKASKYTERPTYLTLRSEAENMAAEALDRDIIKSKDFNDYLTKVAEMEQVPKDIKVLFDRYKADSEGADAYYDRKAKEIVLSNKDKGTALHEMGHARLHASDRGSSRSESQMNDRNLMSYYLPQKAMEDPDYLKYIVNKPVPEDPNEPTWFGNSTEAKDFIAQNSFKGDIPQVKYPNVKTSSDNLKLMNQAIDDKRAWLVALGGSGGHHDGHVLYPVDRTLEKWTEGMSGRGFDEIKPEDNPKFEQLKSLIKTVRNPKQ